MQTRACLLNIPCLLGATAYQLVQEMLMLILKIMPGAWEKFGHSVLHTGAVTCEYHGAIYFHTCMTRVNDELKCSRGDPVWRACAVKPGVMDLARWLLCKQIASITTIQRPLKCLQSPAGLFGKILLGIQPSFFRTHELLLYWQHSV